MRLVFWPSNEIELPVAWKARNAVRDYWEIEQLDQKRESMAWSDAHPPDRWLQLSLGPLAEAGRQWSRVLTGYRPKTLRRDALAGVNVAVLELPQAVAYAVVAQVPPEYSPAVLEAQPVVQLLKRIAEWAFLVVILCANRTRSLSSQSVGYGTHDDAGRYECPRRSCTSAAMRTVEARPDRKGILVCPAPPFRCKRSA